MTVGDPIYDVSSYGPIGPDVDNWPALQAAITACGSAGGGTVEYPPLTLPISRPLMVTAPYVRMVGASRGGTRLQAMTGFQGAALLMVRQADNCSLEQVFITSQATSSAAAPAGVSGIQVLSSRNFLADALDFEYLGGYCLEALGSSTLSPYAPYGMMVTRLHCSSVAGGIHTLGIAPGGDNVQAWFSNINLEGVDGPFDALLVEDSDDVLVQNINGAIGHLAPSFFHIKGGSSFFLVNPDVAYYDHGGVVNASSPILWVDTSANSISSGVTVSNGVLQGGAPNVLATVGSGLYLSNVHINGAQTTGAVINGSASYFHISDCEFNNNSKGGGAWDLQINNASARGLVRGNFFRSPIATNTPGKVNASTSTANAGRVRFVDNYLDVVTPGNLQQAFDSASYPSVKLPYIVRGNHNVNPGGTVPVVVGASPYTIPACAFDTTYYVAGGSVTSIAVGGVTLTGITSGPVRVPAQGTCTITYTAAPNVTGYAE